MSLIIFVSVGERNRASERILIATQYLHQISPLWPVQGNGVRGTHEATPTCTEILTSTSETARPLP